MLGRGFMVGGQPGALGGTTTWNPSDKDAGVVLSGANRIMAVSGSSAGVRSTSSVTPPSSAKLYAEFHILAAGCSVGFGKATVSLSAYLGADINGCGYRSGGDLWNNAISRVTAPTYSAGDVIGVAVNAENGHQWWAKNGVWINGDPGTDTFTGAGLAWDTINPLYLIASANAAGSVSINTGADGFDYDVPANFTQWG